MFRYSYSEVKSYFEDKQCLLLTSEQEYTDSRQKLSFKCVCGKIGIRTFNQFKVKKREKCQECKPLRLNFEKTKAYFESKGCKLLESAININSRKPMNYICNCGQTTKTILHHFRNGDRCKKCNHKKRSNSAKLMWQKEDFVQKHLGEKNGKWNPNLTDQQRQQYKKNYKEYKEYKQWRKNVYTRDGFVCQICLKGEHNLNAHHLHSYRDNEELRYDINNGITLCKKCHIDFHKNFGYGKNTPQQFQKYCEGLKNV